MSQEPETEAKSGGEGRRSSLRRAGASAWRATVLVGATVIVVALFLGMAYLVYLSRMADEPLVLFVGVVLGFLVRSVVRYL